MNNLRIVKDDILKDWMMFRDESINYITSPEDNQYYIQFEEISKKILNSIPKQNRAFVEEQLNKLDNNFMDYIDYWNEKYFRNGFCDGMELIIGRLR